MAKQYILDVEDLSDEGVLTFLSIAIQTKIESFDDWKSFGPLIDQMRIGLSYFESKASGDGSAKTILTGKPEISEPWWAEIENMDGSFSQCGSSATRAIGKVIIVAYMKGEQLNVPQELAERYLSDPESVEQIELD